MSNQLKEPESDSWKNYITVPIIFLIGGLAGTGKTTSANLMYDILMERGAGSYALQSLAKAVKNTAKKGFGWDGIKTTRGRILLQGIGEVARAYDEDVWVRQAMHLIIDDYPIPVNAVLFDDWRFPNELDYIKKNYTDTHKIVTVRIGASSREILKGTPEYNEISETSLPLTNEDSYYDYYVDNEGSMAELENKLRVIVEDVIRN